jgi:hypothetical protein
MDFDDIDDVSPMEDDACEVDECEETDALIGWLTLDRLGDGRDGDNSDDEYVEEEDDGMDEWDSWPEDV